MPRGLLVNRCARRWARGLLVGLLALAATAATRPAHAETDAPVRVLVVGDSLSQGFAGDWTWRYWVWREFARQHVPVDFVGPRRLPSYGTRYERSWAWDGDHAALGGSTLDYHLPRVPQLVTSYAPDVLVVELGYNDVAQGDSPATVERQLQELILTARLLRPGMRVVLAQLPSGPDEQRNAVTARINVEMARWALLHRVVVAHNRTGEGSGTLAWDTAKDTFDGLHPNATGQTLLADRIAQALHRAGVLPALVSDVYRDRVWSPDARPDVVPGTGALQVRWATAAAQIRMHTVQVRVDGVPRTGWLSGASAAASAGVRLAVAPGRHVVQLVPRRASMIGAPSGPVYVTVG